MRRFDSETEANEYKAKHQLHGQVAEFDPARGKWSLVYPLDAYLKVHGSDGPGAGSQGRLVIAGATWSGDGDGAIATLADGSKVAVRIGAEEISLRAVLKRLNDGEQGDDLPVLMEAFGVAYDAACDAVFGRRILEAAALLKTAASVPLEASPSHMLVDPNEFLLAEYASYVADVAEGNPMLFDDWLAGSDIPEIVEARARAATWPGAVANQAVRGAGHARGAVATSYAEMNLTLSFAFSGEEPRGTDELVEWVSERLNANTAGARVEISRPTGLLAWPDFLDAPGFGPEHPDYSAAIKDLQKVESWLAMDREALIRELLAQHEQIEQHAHSKARAGALKADPAQGQADGGALLDHTVSFELSITAGSPEQAAQLAFEDLRDVALGPWVADVVSSSGSVVQVEVGEIDGRDGYTAPRM